MDVKYNTTMVQFEEPFQKYTLDDGGLATKSKCMEDFVEFHQSGKFITDAAQPTGYLKKYGKYITEALNIIDSQKENPKQTQIMFLMDVVNLAVKNESSFLELTSNQVLQQLMSLAKPTILTTEEDVKLLFLKVLNSILEHPSGVKWITETNYWADVYSLLFQYQRINNVVILELGYQFLATLLENSIELNRPFCIEFIYFLTKPLLLTVENLKVSKSTSVIAYKQQIYNDISPHGLCLVEILEKLLERRCIQILNLLVKLKVNEACDNIATLSDDQELSILMYRVVIMLSFYELSEIFDGIKVITQNSLSLSGVHRIIGRETDKGNIQLALEVVHYALKYFKNNGINLPQHLIKDKLVDIESELLCFQIIPICVMLNFFNNKQSFHFDDLTDLKSIVRYCIGSELMTEFTSEGFRYGYALNEKIIRGSLDIIIQATDIIYKTKSVYSMQSINRIIMIMASTLTDAYEYFKDIVKQRIITYEEQMLVEKVLEIIVDFMETPNINLYKYLKFLDIPTVIHNFLYTISWSAPVVIKGLRLLKLLIAQHMSPEMLLLIDSVKDSALGDIGHMLFVKLFSSDWEIRQVALSVVAIIAHTANNSFASFRDILIVASLPEVVATLCIEDRNPIVRAAAFKCLQDVFIVDNIDEKLRSDELTIKILESILKEPDSVAKKEAIKLIGVIYWHNKDTDDYKHLFKIYECLEKVAFNDKKNVVQQEVIRFWRMVMTKHLISIGWADKTFPPILFSKKIVRMTNEEIGKRIFGLLNDLSNTPCLNVIKHFCYCKDLFEEVSTVLDDWLQELYSTYVRYKITESSIKSHEEDANISSMIMSFNSSLDDTDAFTYIEEVLFLPAENTLECEVNAANVGVCETNHYWKISPSQFVRLVYDKIEMKETSAINYGDVC